MRIDDIKTEDQMEIRRFLIILGIIIVLVIGVYFFTRIFVTKDLKNNTEEQVTEGKIDYNKTLIGSMLTKNDKDYYVFIYDNEDINAIYYNALMTSYSRNTDALKVYIADLKNELNKNYYTENESEVSIQDFEHLKIKDFALVKITNNKVNKIITNLSEIETELAYHSA